MNEYREQIYNQWREEHADDPAKAVGWRNQEALDARFNCTLNHLSHKEFDGLSILDVGCGASLNLLRYLPDSDFSYTGIDCNDASLRYASEQWNIPYNEDINLFDSRQLVKDEYLNKVSGGFGYDVIISQGIYQEFDTIKSVKNHVCKLSELLVPGGELLIMTPANRVIDAEGHLPLRLSAYDAISIAEETGLPYSVSLGDLGEHIIIRIWKKED